jgi:hypothetical protein
MEGQHDAQSRRQHTRSTVVVAVDAAETAPSLSPSSLSGSGATTEETNKRDGGGRGEKRRRHDDELEAVAAELAWRPAVAAAVAAVVAAAAVAAAAQRNLDCLNFVDEQSQRVDVLVTPAKNEKVRRRSTWTSPSEVSGKKTCSDTQESIRSENMDRRRALVPSH